MFTNSTLATEASFSFPTLTQFPFIHSTSIFFFNIKRAISLKNLPFQFIVNFLEGKRSAHRVFCCLFFQLNINFDQKCDNFT